MSLIVNIYYTGENGRTRKIVEETAEMIKNIIINNDK